MPDAPSAPPETAAADAGPTAGESARREDRLSRIRIDDGYGPLPWSTGAAAGGDFPEEFFGRPVLEVARDLLGARLATSIGGVHTAGVIVEVEAYAGRNDPASHAATLHGPTRRNAAMFGPPGRAYVYRSYGVHWCMNVVTGALGDAQAVLIRGLEPLEGVTEMSLRRRGRGPLAAGPGRLCEALGITGALYGHDLTLPPLTLSPGWSVPEERVGVSGRVGVSAAADWPYRLYVRGSSGVSRPGRWVEPAEAEDA